MSLNPALGRQTQAAESEVYRASSKRPELHIVRHTVSLPKSKIGRKRRRGVLNWQPLACGFLREDVGKERSHTGRDKGRERRDRITDALQKGAKQRTSRLEK